VKWRPEGGWGPQLYSFLIWGSISAHRQLLGTAIHSCSTSVGSLHRPSQGILGGLGFVFFGVCNDVAEVGKDGGGGGRVFSADQAGHSVSRSWFRAPSGTHEQLFAPLTSTCF